MGEQQDILVSRDGHVATITINRPQVHNALSEATLSQLHGVLLDLQRDEHLRAVILTGQGQAAFIAGADLNELSALTPTSAHEYVSRNQDVISLLERLGVPVIAAINGWCLGGGCEIALACTFRIAAEGAKFGLPEVTLGIMPGYGGTQRLARLVGRSRALDLILTGRRIPAAEAYRIGLIDRVVTAETLLGEARALADLIASNAPRAIRLSLEAVDAGLEIPLREGLQLEAKLFATLTGTDDMREGTRAFLEKRKPVFTGR